MTNPDGCLVCGGNHLKEKRPKNAYEKQRHLADIDESIAYQRSRLQYHLDMAKSIRETIDGCREERLIIEEEKMKENWNKRSRKRNSKKNRSSWAITSSKRTRPITAADYDDLKKGKFNWSK